MAQEEQQFPPRVKWSSGAGGRWPDWTSFGTPAPSVGSDNDRTTRWPKLGGKEYAVDQASLIGVEGKLGLVFMLPLTTWSGEEGADKYNREFLAGFIAAHPDYTRVFEFLLARALTPDRSGGFGTLLKLGQGFQ
mgnify:CR=1 FL=1